MAEFCTCGSLMIKGSCTNRKCENRFNNNQLASYDQIEYIKDLVVKAGVADEYDYENMTALEAGEAILELVAIIELGKDDIDD